MATAKALEIAYELAKKSAGPGYIPKEKSVGKLAAEILNGVEENRNTKEGSNA